MEAPDNLREELHGILRAADRVRAPKPDQGFLEEFLDAGFYFLHAVKCWTAAKFPGFGRKATRDARRERGEPLLRACVKTHLDRELDGLEPKRICALGELAYCGLRILDESLDATARPSDGQTFRLGPRAVLYTCFPSGNLVRGRPASEFTRDHVGVFLSKAVY